MSSQVNMEIGFVEQVRKMGFNFWVCNGIEILERLAFFGVRAVLPLYMINATGGGLGLSYTQKGTIYGIWALLQCLIPMVSGGYTEAYGYKKSMAVAFTLNIMGYLVMANASAFGDGGAFWTMLLAGCLVGTGTAIFKPPVQGGMARALDESNSSVGFGIFYWVVNVGGFFAPMAAAALRGNELAPTWSHVFYGAAIVTAINFIPALFLFREPELDPEARGKKSMQVFAHTMRTLWNDRPMLWFLLIISGFWFMFMQVWDLLPNFIDEWVDSRALGVLLSNVLESVGLSSMAGFFLGADGSMKPEMVININPATILLLTVPLAMISRKMKMMTALAIGMAISLVGFIGAGLTTAGWLVCFMLFVFTVGEAINGPKFSEYIGMSAPPEKRAQYMGYSNIPFAIGWAVGNWVSGPLYQVFSSRTDLARRYMEGELGMTAEQVAAIDAAQVMETLSSQLGTDIHGATAVLWDTYAPWQVWCYLGIVGLASLVGMLWNYRKAQARRDGVAGAA